MLTKVFVTFCPFDLLREIKLNPLPFELFPIPSPNFSQNPVSTLLLSLLIALPKTFTGTLLRTRDKRVIHYWRQNLYIAIVGVIEYGALLRIILFSDLLLSCYSHGQI